MAQTALRAVAQVKAAQTTTSQSNARTSSLKAAPKQIGRLAAAVLANVGAARLALADEIEGLPEITLPSVNVEDVQAASTDLAQFVAENPLIVGGGALLLVVPLAIATLTGGGVGGKGAKATSVAQALQALKEDPRVVLVDVRSKADAKAQGTPDLSAVKRRALSLPLAQVVKGQAVVDDAFADKFARLGGVSEESLVILLDSDGGRVAKQAASAVAGSVAQVYTVSGGAEAWAASGPWRQPGKGLSLSLPNFREVGTTIKGLSADFKSAPSLTKGGLLAAAAVAAGFLVINEAELVLELAGLFAVGNFLLKLVFAEEREKTLTEIKTLVDDKVAIQDVPSDLNKIAKAVLEESAEAAPAAAAEAAPAAAAPVSNAPAASSADEPENVAEAKAWIDNWKSSSA